MLNAECSRDPEAYADGEHRFDPLFTALEAGRESEAARVLEDLRLREQQTARRLRVAWGQIQSRIAETSRTAAEQEQQSILVITVMAFVALRLGLVLLWWSQRLLVPLPRLQRRVAAAGVHRIRLADSLRPALRATVSMMIAMGDSTKTMRVMHALMARSACPPACTQATTVSDKRSPLHALRGWGGSLYREYIGVLRLQSLVVVGAPCWVLFESRRRV